jgi:hypothetical protein
VPRHRPVRATGIALDTARFIDAFLLACALDDSPALDCDAYKEANANFGSVTMDGRKPGLTLTRDGQPVTLQAWADDLMADIETVGRRLDEIRGGDEHVRAIAAQREKLADPERTPSARVLRTMRENGQSFLAFALAQAKRMRPISGRTRLGGGDARGAGARGEVAGRTGRTRSEGGRVVRCVRRRLSRLYAEPLQRLMAAAEAAVRRGSRAGGTCFSDARTCCDRPRPA